SADPGTLISGTPTAGATTAPAAVMCHDLETETPMTTYRRLSRTRHARALTFGIACTAAFAILASTAVAGLVSSLGIAQRTIAGKPTKIVVDRRGDTVYELSGESLA